MDNKLIEKYDISKMDAYLAEMVYRIKGSRICPEYIYKLSLKKYGFKDNLARYYTEKYSGILLGNLLGDINI